MCRTTAIIVIGLGVATLAVCRDGGTEGPTSQEETIGSDGGTITLGSIEVEFDDGALTEDTDVTITRASGGDVPAGHIGPAYELQPDDVTFAAAVTISYQYNENLVEGDPADLALAYAADGTWTPVTSSVAGGVVRAVVTHFSIWGVIDTTPPADGDADSDSDGDGDGDGDGDADGDGDGDGDTDSDSDSDSDADCVHSTCSMSSGMCSCEWTCDGEPAYVWCDLMTQPYQCDCNSDEVMDCDLVDPPLTEEACGDATCCFQGADAD
jgi:hypothetical protein